MDAVEVVEDEDGPGMPREAKVRAMLEEGLADIAAGRVVPMETVIEDLRAAVVRMRDGKRGAAQRVIALSAAARADIAGLIALYEARDRLEAVVRLSGHIEAGCSRYSAGTARVVAAPRPYPGLAALGLRWVKQGPQWLVFTDVDGGTVLVRVFHEAADIMARAAGR